MPLLVAEGTMLARDSEEHMPRKRKGALCWFARAFGLGLTLAGFGGLLGLGGMLGLGEILGLRDLITPRDELRDASGILYLLTGILFSYVGLGRLEYELSRYVIGGVGALYLLSSIIAGFGNLGFAELSLDLYTLGYYFEHATLGILFLLVTKLSSPREYVGEEGPEEGPVTSATIEDEPQDRKEGG